MYHQIHHEIYSYLYLFGVIHADKIFYNLVKLQIVDFDGTQNCILYGKEVVITTVVPQSTTDATNSSYSDKNKHCQPGNEKCCHQNTAFRKSRQIFSALSSRLQKVLDSLQAVTLHLEPGHFQGNFQVFHIHAYLPLKSKRKEETGDQWAKSYIERPIKAAQAKV